MADEGRTHFVGDGCEGGHWGDIPAGAQLIEAKLDAGIPLGKQPAHYIGICAGPSVGETEPSAWIPMGRLSALERVAECSRGLHLTVRNLLDGIQGSMSLHVVLTRELAESMYLPGMARKLEEALKALDDGEK